MTDRMYVEGHRPAMGWWDGNGFHAACECGAESGPQATRNLAERVIGVHLDEAGQRGVIVIEQDEAAEAPDENTGRLSYGDWPAGY